jgi:hypothetical protein
MGPAERAAKWTPTTAPRNGLGQFVRVKQNNIPRRSVTGGAIDLVAFTVGCGFATARLCQNAPFPVAAARLFDAV